MYFITIIIVRANSINKYKILKIWDILRGRTLADVIPSGPLLTISILAGSAEQGNPDYDPDEAFVSQGHVIEWTNDDEVSHTVTSSLDFGETFDSGLLNAGETFVLDSNKLDLGSYEYFCIVHPWMISTIVIEEPVE